MRVLVDMSLPPGWVPVLQEAGWRAVHWSAIGDASAPDETLLEWARVNDYVVFTHDLDFGALLALTEARGPSVVQVRTQDVMPGYLGKLVIQAFRQHQGDLAAGALVVIDERRTRVRMLPVGR